MDGEIGASTQIDVHGAMATVSVARNLLVGFAVTPAGMVSFGEVCSFGAPKIGRRYGCRTLPRADGNDGLGVPNVNPDCSHGKLPDEHVVHRVWNIPKG